MKDCEPPQLPAGLRKALRCLSLLLLSALALEDGRAGPGLRTLHLQAESNPYLPVLGTPSLRFAEALPPPDLVTRPPAIAPPMPARSPAEASVAVANASAARAALPVPAVAPKPAPLPAPVSAPPAHPVAPPKRVPPRILPDDGRPMIRPEDILPYFEIPGSRDVTILAPTAPSPNAIPPSSATYTQTP